MFTDLTICSNVFILVSRHLRCWATIRWNQYRIQRCRCQYRYPAVWPVRKRRWIRWKVWCAVQISRCLPRRGAEARIQLARRWRWRGSTSVWFVRRALRRRVRFRVIWGRTVKRAGNAIAATSAARRLLCRRDWRVTFVPTPARSRTNASIAASRFRWRRISACIGVFTRRNGRTNVAFADVRLSTAANCIVTCVSTPANGRTSALCAPRHLYRVANWWYTCVRIPAKNRTCASRARRALLVRSN